MVDPGSNCEVIQRDYRYINKQVCATLLTHTTTTTYYESGLGQRYFWNPPGLYVAESEASWPLILLSWQPLRPSSSHRYGWCPMWPAEHTFVLHEEYQVEEFRFIALPTPATHWWRFTCFPDGHFILTGDASFPRNHWSNRLTNWVVWNNSFISKPSSLPLPNYDVYPGHGPVTTTLTKTLIHFSNIKTKDQSSLVFWLPNNHTFFCDAIPCFFDIIGCKEVIKVWHLTLTRSLAGACTSTLSHEFH